MHGPLARRTARRGRPSRHPDPHAGRTGAQWRPLPKRLFGVPCLHPCAPDSHDRHEPPHPWRSRLRRDHADARAANDGADIPGCGISGLRRGQAARVPAARPDRVRRCRLRRGRPHTLRSHGRLRDVPRRARLSRTPVRPRHEQQRLHRSAVAPAGAHARYELGHSGDGAHDQAARSHPSGVLVSLVPPPAPADRAAGDLPCGVPRRRASLAGAGGLVPGRAAVPPASGSRAVCPNGRPPDPCRPAGLLRPLHAHRPPIARRCGLTSRGGPAGRYGSLLHFGPRRHAWEARHVGQTAFLRRSGQCPHDLGWGSGR